MLLATLFISLGVKATCVQLGPNRPSLVPARIGVGCPDRGVHWPWATYRGDEPVEWLPSLCVFDCDGAKVIAKPDGGDNATRVAVGNIFL